MSVTHRMRAALVGGAVCALLAAAQPGGLHGFGPEIVSTSGKVIWYHPLPQNSVVWDFRTQTWASRC